MAGGGRLAPGIFLNSHFQFLHARPYLGVRRGRYKVGTERGKERKEKTEVYVFSFLPTSHCYFQCRKLNEVAYTIPFLVFIRNPVYLRIQY